MSLKGHVEPHRGAGIQLQEYLQNTPHLDMDLQRSGSSLHRAERLAQKLKDLKLLSEKKDLHRAMQLTALASVGHLAPTSTSNSPLTQPQEASDRSFYDATHLTDRIFPAVSLCQ